MLAEERFAAILSILQKQRTVTVLELTQALSISESTIRRDLVALHKMGKLKQVHGGATLLHKEYGLYETEGAARSEEHVEEKKRIARYAASLIQAHDFVYIDAGSTTLHMVEYLKEEETRNVLVKEHEELTKAIRQRDVKKAQEISFRHIENQRRAIIQSIEAEEAGKEKK